MVEIFRSTVLLSFRVGCSCIGLALLWCLAAAEPALAHAILVDSTPAANASIPAGEARIALRYNSRIDKGRSKLTLTYPDQTQRRLTIEDAGAEDTLVASATLQPGSYDLRWQVLAIDGHITRGDVPFQVKGD